MTTKTKGDNNAMPKLMMTRNIRVGETSEHGFVKGATWIGQSCYVDLTKLSYFDNNAKDDDEKKSKSR